MITSSETGQVSHALSSHDVRGRSRPTASYSKCTAEIHGSQMTAYSLIRRVIHQPTLDVYNGCTQSSLKNGSPASVCIAMTAGADKGPLNVPGRWLCSAARWKKSPV